MAYHRTREPGLIDDKALKGIDYWAVLQEDNPLVLWKLNEPSSTLMLDSSGNDRHGTYYSSPNLGTASIIPTVEATCVDFNGTSHYASVLDAAWMDVSSITVECVATIDAMDGGLVARYDSLLSWHLVTGATTMGFAGRDSTNTYRGEFVATSPGGPHHYAGTYEPGEPVRFYIDGVEVLASTNSVGGLLQGTNPITVGRYYNTRYHNGKIQGVAIYDTSLSASRILVHAQAAGLA